MTQKQLLAVGGFAAFAFALFWFAPIRKQAMNENHCIRMVTQQRYKLWQMNNKGKEATKENRDWFRANAYIKCRR